VKEGLAEVKEIGQIEVEVWRQAKVAPALTVL